jgi:hypothetical protein
LPAFARKQTFITNSPLGIGFKAGLENHPQLDFIKDPQSVDSTTSYFFAFEPYFDFANFVIRTTASLHYDPMFRSTSSDATGTFRDSSDTSSFHYGVQLKLVPFFSQDLTSRAYVVGGISNVVVTAKNNRTYVTGSSTVTNEKVSGTGQEILVGAGFETFMAQNYSLEIEAGYQALHVNEFGYKSATDIDGVARNEGETVRSSATNREKKFHQMGPYVTLALNLNF